jgi:hypothetical protein
MQTESVQKDEVIMRWFSNSRIITERKPPAKVLTSVTAAAERSPCCYLLQNVDMTDTLSQTSLFSWLYSETVRMGCSSSSETVSVKKIQPVSSHPLRTAHLKPHCTQTHRKGMIQMKGQCKTHTHTPGRGALRWHA